MDKLEPVSTIANRLVNGDRNADYSHPLDNFSRIAVLWSAVLRFHVTYKEVALCLNQLKVSREVEKDKRDNLIDGIGYLECLDMCIQEEKRRLAEGWTFDPTTGVWTKPTYSISALEDLLKLPGAAGTQPFDIQPYPWTPFDPVVPAYPYTGDPPAGGVLPKIICKNESTVDVRKKA